jgi:hypothetical protein
MFSQEGSAAERNKRLKDPAVRARIKREMKHGSPGWWNIVAARDGWKNMVIRATAHDLFRAATLR